MKLVFDRIFSGLALIVFAPIIVIAAILVWAQDRHNPFYCPERVGHQGHPFKLFKLRSMIVNADLSQVDTTTAQDPRITPLGQRIRRYKLDELPQFANVFVGHMSIVGPRPNIDREVRGYSEEERRMLSVLPGITDLSSIVFSDLGEILVDAEDPNLAYNQLIRPWKSRLALFYVDRRTFWMDVQIVWLTAVAIVSSSRARAGVVAILSRHGASPSLIEVAKRTKALDPFPPPGMSAVVQGRGL